ncbi:MAG: DUF952 domain-containing protein [Gammaproteobacteria bacterium]
MTNHLYHITTAPELAAAARTGVYLPEAFPREGFIHCSHAYQLLATASKHYPGRTGLVVLRIDPAKVPARVVEEDLHGTGQAFPHIYGPLPMAAVVAVHDFPCGPNGFALPAGVV